MEKKNKLNRMLLVASTVFAVLMMASCKNETKQTDSSSETTTESTSTIKEKEVEAKSNAATIIVDDSSQ
ncbi:hypothetical protein ACYSNR_14620 [Enterococcus sp. LJL128]|uniref:hypothetical protein n=1 Tax=Enterococcus sp. LJL51 TaxID=3416656 RepID=UPI003CE6F0D8